MVTLEQVEQLDERVRKVIGLIESLRHENARLFSENRRLLEEGQRLEYHLQESERRSLALTGAQELLEKGLLGAIDRLDSVSQEVASDAKIARPQNVSVSTNEDLAKNDQHGNMAMSELLRDPVADELLNEALAEDEKKYSKSSSNDESSKMDIF